MSVAVASANAHASGPQPALRSRVPDVPPTEGVPAATSTAFNPVTATAEASSNPPSSDIPGTRTLLIEPRDPLLARDARPFSSEPGARAFTLPWPWPRTIAKTIRALIGSGAGTATTWTAERRRAMAAMAVHGPLMVAKERAGAPWEMYVPAPRDVVFHRDTESDGEPSKRLNTMILRPAWLQPNEGVTEPPAPSPASAGGRGAKAFGNVARDEFGRHAVIEVTADVKPDTDVPAWWRLDDARRWLAWPGEEDDARDHLPLSAESEQVKQGVRGLRGPLTDARMHVSIEPGTQTHVEGALFTTESLAFPGGYVQAEIDDQVQATHMAMLVRLVSAPAARLPEVAAFGGERRISRITDRSNGGELFPSWPEAGSPPAGWAHARGLRLQLVTPAIFQFGWLPAWLADGTIPGLGGTKLHLELVGVAMDRRQAVSGWFSTRRNTERDPRAPQPRFSTHEELNGGGPAATDYVVPSGSVYFFRLAAGSGPLTEEIWRRLWLAPVSDLEIARNQGFGLVLPGIWNTKTVENSADQVIQETTT